MEVEQDCIGLLAISCESFDNTIAFLHFQPHILVMVYKPTFFFTASYIAY